MHVVQWPDLSNILINLNQDIVSLWSRAAKNGPWSLYKVVVTENYLNNSDFDGIIMITLDTKSCFQVIWNNRSITPTTQKVLWNGRGGGSANFSHWSTRPPRHSEVPSVKYFPVSLFFQLSQVWWKNCLHRSCEVCRGVANCGGAVITAWLSYHLQ